MNLDALRARLNVLDRQLLELLAERQSIGVEIARVKREAGLPTRDFKRERDVILNARASAAELGIPPALAENVVRLLIQNSLTTQEQAQLVAQGRGTGRSALVIGGAGKMGRWFSGFLTSQGYRVTIADPVSATGQYERVADWRASALNQEIIVVATPLGTANEVLLELAKRKPSGIVFDLGSLKTPLRTGLMALKAADVKVTSLHPMFGPDTELLSGRHVIFIDLGSNEALTAAQDLFSSTMAERVVMSIDEHDRLIAYVLGLSHALNISFFTALAESGEAAPRLAALSSTTYDAQIEVASKVAQESPDLYFEIQHLNAYGREPLPALRTAVEKVIDAVANNKPEEFKALMTRGREYLAGRVRRG